MQTFHLLTRHLSILENDPIGEWMDLNHDDDPLGDSFIPPFFVYSPAVENFIADVYHFAAVCPEFHMKKHVQTLQNNSITSVFDADASTLDAHCILAMIMHVIRGERFREGYMADALQHGHMKNWLKRLTELECEAI